MVLSAADLAGMQQALIDLQPETLTITRTGKSYSGRVTDTGRDAHIDGMPRLIPQSRMELAMPATADVRFFDEVTSPKGTFLVLNTDAPRTWPTQLVVTAIRSLPMTLATTMREATAAVDVSTPIVSATHLKRLELRALGDFLFVPVGADFMQDEFGAAGAEIFSVLANWPQSADFANAGDVTEDYPVSRGDRILTPDGKSYDVVELKAYHPDYLAIYVQVPQRK
jgi:hypothetical protein